MDEQALEELRAQLYDWQQLIKHPGWTRLKSYVEAQLQFRQISVLEGNKPEKELDGLRGEYRGIRLFEQIPQLEIDRLEEEIQPYLREVDEDEDQNAP